MTSFFDFGKLLHALTNKTVGTTLILTLLYNTAFSMFIYAFQSASIKVYHMSANQISLIFSIFGVIGLISQLILLSLVTKTFGIKRTFTTSLLLVGVAFIAMYYTSTIPAFIAANIALALVNAYVQPLSQTILSEETDPKEQGEMQGLNASYMSIGQIVGPILAGVAATFSISSPFIGAGLLVIACYFCHSRSLLIFPRKLLHPKSRQSSRGIITIVS